jgi:hypothetical protein
MLGAVLSSLTVTLSLPTLPAMSSALPRTSRPAVSVLTTTSAVTVPGLTPDPASLSLASKWTVTSELFQSELFGFGDNVWVTVGAMLSHFSATLLAGSALPALSTAQ